MEKRNINLSVKDLYVASFIWDDMMEIEPWVQYESFGKLHHSLNVSKSRTLVYKEKDKEGKIHYYNYSTGKEVKLCVHTSNFTTRSCVSVNVMASISVISGINYLFPNISVESDLVGLLVPFNEFAKEKIGVNPEKISVAQASKLVKFYNMFKGGKPFRLTDNEEESHKIISEKLGYNFKPSSTINPETPKTKKLR